MADLSFLAAGTQDADEPVKRVVSRDRKPNPFEAKLEESWEGGSTDESGKVRGKAMQVQTYKAEDTTAVVRALRLAGKHLRIGVRISAPTEKYMDDEKQEERARYIAGIVKFEAAELRQQDNGGNGDGNGGNTESADESEREPEYA
jgi:hypothetical protein